MKDDEVDTSRPFIAVRHDAEGDVFTPTLGEYLVNPLAAPLLDVSVSMSGFFSDDDGVAVSVPNVDRFSEIAPGGFVRFALSTRDEWDEFVMSWFVQYSVTGQRERLQFGCFKRMEGVVRTTSLPILDGHGFLVPRHP